MKKILIFQNFKTNLEARNAELEECISHNINLGFDEVIIFNDDIEPTIFKNNIKNIKANKRLSYGDYIDFVGSKENLGSFVVLTNTDIKLDSGLLSLSDVIEPIDFIALSRYEANGLIAPDPAFTQDTWAMLCQPIPPTILYQSGIPLGLPGCENRFAEIIFSAGHRISNPSLSIKNMHVQAIPSIHKFQEKMFGAILAVPPCSIEQLVHSNPEIHPTPYYLPCFSDRLITIG
jgi:hypothetical protein